MEVGGGGGVLHTQRSQTYDLLVTRFNGGSVAEWSAHWTHNLVVLGSSRALATYWINFVLGRPKFESLATIVNSPLVASCQLGFLILLCCI